MSLQLERRSVYVLASKDSTNPDGYKWWIGKRTEFLTHFHFESGRYKMYDSNDQLVGQGTYSVNGNTLSLKSENGNSLLYNTAMYSEHFLILEHNPYTSYCFVQ